MIASRPVWAADSLSRLQESGCERLRAGASGAGAGLRGPSGNTDAGVERVEMSQEVGTIRTKFGVMDVPDVQRLKQLQDENSRLKKLVAD